MKRFFAETRAYIVLLLSLLVLAVWVLVLGSRPVSGSAAPLRVTIAKGTSARKIGEILGQKGLIRSAFVFSLTCRISGASDKLKPGVYEFSQSMSVPEIIQRLQSGHSLEIWVTIPEGFTAYQIARLLQEKELVDGESFMRVALTQGFGFPSYPSVVGESLEGYLFPDTYLVARGTDPATIIKKMLDAFEQKVVVPHGSELREAVRKRFDMGEDQFPLGLRKLLTAASLVEREAKTEEDRRLIAAVIWNRLDRHMKLEVDATVTYSPGQTAENKPRILYEDLENDSPYNTYKHPGLPPAPICNPGVASIMAVVDPAPVDYLYYVAKEDGSHIFSRTYSEHLAAKRRVRSGGS